MQVDQLVAELLATGTMNEDTVLDLDRMLAESRAGTLDPEDEAYLRALHARILALPMPEPEETPEGATLDGLDIEAWRKRALAAETRLAELVRPDAP